jgi:hypothetical protein
MAWPEALMTLLGRRDSRASRALRWSLRGLQASLRAAVDEMPDEDGCAQLRTLLADLDTLLCTANYSPGTALPSDAPGDATVEPADGPRLTPLARAVAADERFQAELKASPIPDGSDDDIWNGVQRLLLRVRPHLAEEWRHRCQEFTERVGGRLDEWAAVSLPLRWDEGIYPGVTGEVRAAGLRSAPTGPLDPRLGLPAHDDLQDLAGVTSTCLWFVDHDPHLCHCLKSVFRFGVTPLTAEQRERYATELLRLWERVREHAGASHEPAKEQLRALLDLDEAVNSLVYQPPAAPESWWARLQGQTREALFAARDRAIQAGCAVHVQALGGTFADINRLAPDSLQVDFGVPGEVSACLRVWARIDGEEIKGRVLYRSREEDT